MKKVIQKISVFLFVAFLAFSAGSAAQAKGVCVYKGEIYYNIKGKIYKLNPSTKKKKLVKSIPNAFDISSLSASDGKLYMTIDSWMQTGGEVYSIYSLDLKSKKLKMLAKGAEGQLKGKYIYYIQTKSGEYGLDESVGIGKMKKNGSGKKTIYSGKPSPYGMFTIYKKRLYFSENGYKSVELNGKGLRAETDERALTIDRNFIYYERSNSSYSYDIYRQRIGSSEKQLVIADVQAADVRDNILYYAKNIVDPYAGKCVIYKKNLKSGKTKKIYTEDGIHNLKCCGRWLFLTKYLPMKNGLSPNTQNLVITTSGKKVKNLQKYFVS